MGTSLGDPFPDLARVSRLLKAGSIGWSATRNGLGLWNLQLATDRCRVDTGQRCDVQSSFFDSLPAGSTRLDSVLVMRDVSITCSVPKKNNLTIDRTLAPRAQRGQTDTDY